MGRAAAFIAVAVLTVFLVLRFVSPALLNPQKEEKRGRERENNSNIPTAQMPQSPNNSMAQPLNVPIQNPKSEIQNSIEPPRSTERRSYEDIEAKRTQFYASLRASFQYILVARPAPDDQAVLEIYMTDTDPFAASDIVQKAIMPDASRNGFEKVRFFQPNSSGGAERYRLDAEATSDRSGVWTTFRH